VQPPEHIDVDELVVRVYTVVDAPTICSAVGADLDHLRPWMPWVAFEPMSVSDRVALIDTWTRERLDTGDTTYGVFRGPRLIGGTGLHCRATPNVREIGYWIASDEIGRGTATRVAAALTTTALGMAGVDKVEIRHDRNNVRSRRVTVKLGFGLVEERARTPKAAAECGWELRWRTTDAEWNPGGGLPTAGRRP
jgi:RimJ/RimL family protein N-acetyltransferase